MNGGRFGAGNSTVTITYSRHPTEFRPGNPSGLLSEALHKSENPSHGSEWFVQVFSTNGNIWEFQKSPKRQFGDRSSPHYLSTSKLICLNVSWSIKWINRSKLERTQTAVWGFLNA